MDADVKATILPCPFCGGEPTISVWEYLSVQCSQCDIVMERFDTNDTIAAWNKRAALDVDAQGQGWMPLNVVDDDIVATDIQGRDIAPAKVLTTVVDGRHVTMRFADSDKPFMSWELLPHIRLFRLAPHAPVVSEHPAPSEAMVVPAPDWANAPDWASYWTRDDSGVTMWWETKPFFDGRIGSWICEDDSKRARGTDLPTLQRRPDAGEGV